jgi:hypothetical protein
VSQEVKFNLMLATPAFGGQLTALYASSVLAFLEACQERHLPVEVAVQWGDSLVSRARQDLVTRFLETPHATHLLFIDADIGFTPAQVFRLMEFDAEMASGVYPYKRLDLERVRRAYDKKAQVRSAELWAYGVEFDDPSRIVMKDGFAKALYAGLGFCLIKKSVFQKMIQRYPDLKYTAGFLPADPFPQSANRYALFNDGIDEATGHYLSEDLSFCRRWTRMGGEIWVDSQSRLQHVGPAVFEGDFSTQFTQEKP